jgi:hypothetical protein
MKLVFCCRRSPELTVEQFQEYWLQQHAGLVNSLRHAIPSMTRYVQSHTVYGPITDAVRSSRGTAEPYDGITEVWVSTDTAGGDPEAAATAMQRLLEDEMTFVDMARSSVFITEEHVISNEDSTVWR